MLRRRAAGGAGPGLREGGGTPVRARRADAHAKLPPGTIRAGSFAVRAAGSSLAGPFTSAIEIPQPIRITTSLAPGTEIPVAPVSLIARLAVNWEGGDAASRVMVVGRVSGFADGLGGPAILSRFVPASPGTCILEGIRVFPGGAFEAGVWH